MFEFGGEIILITVNGNDVQFSSSGFGNVKAPIDGLKLNYIGVIREHPDLETKDDWKEQAIKRFKETIASLSSEMQKCDYIIEDLAKHGYRHTWTRRQGFRPEKQ